MKKLFFLITLLLASLSFASNIITVNGSSELNNSISDELKINGSLSFNNINVKKQIIINGSGRGENLTCDSIKVNGSLYVNYFKANEVKINGSFKAVNAEITGNTKVNGNLDITNGQLKNIEISSKLSTLTDAKVDGDILIKKSNSNKGILKSILEIKGNTVINGDINFEKNGEIHIFDNAKINGTHINATIIKK